MKTKIEICNLTQLEKEYLNALLELRLKEYDEQFKRLCDKYSPSHPMWQKKEDELGAKCNFILNLRQKLGFKKLNYPSNLNEIRDAIREFEMVEVDE